MHLLKIQIGEQYVSVAKAESCFSFNTVEVLFDIVVGQLLKYSVNTGCNNLEAKLILSYSYKIKNL